MCDNKSKSNFPEAFDSGAVLKQTSTTTWFGTNDVRDLSTPGKWPKTVVRVDMQHSTGEATERLWSFGVTSHVEIRDYEKKQ